ncbi:restriction endonuclease subunit S [Kaistella palustris]|uniref:restriction endonuclease subunit S n=1 Tax=Kaistella palustris TaxID=493376 RepID=UPI0006882868|nr:restriction endonuclease subunit S [Kaistella palustris]
MVKDNRIEMPSTGSRNDDGRNSDGRDGACSVSTNYKQTEIGLIPEDWFLFKVGEVITFSGGSQPPLSTFSHERRSGYVRMIQIRDYKTDKFKVFIPENLGRKFCNKNDIMIGRYGPPIFQILKGLEGAYNVALLKAIPNVNVIDKDFAWHFLRSEDLFNFVEKLSQRSSGQTGVDLVELKNYPIPLPPLAEQEAIATALSDYDSWIDSIEEVLAKKRLIKQGAMQELLTPKEDWEVKKLGEMTQLITKGTTPTSVGFDFTENGINFIKVESINKSGVIDLDKTAFISEECHQSLYRSQIKSGDILFSIAGALGRTAIVKENICPANTNQALGIIRLNIGVIDTKYLYYFFNRNEFQQMLNTISVTGAQPNLSLLNLNQFEIVFPSLSEQTRIATILSDMDLEIEALKEKLGKARQIKQGMMQELLTGRVRLV